jgi:DNA methylase
MNTVTADQFLAQTVALLRRMQVKLVRLDGNLVEQDINARRQEADIGFEFAKRVDRIEASLKAVGSNLNLDEWCKQRCGCDISTMRRRKRLYKQWKEYEAKRRELGSCGQAGLLFALSLVSEEIRTIAINRQRLPVRSPVKTISGRADKANSPRLATARCQFITGNSLAELPKLPKRSVNVVVTSPPYWPTKRTYGGNGIGFEKTLSDYVSSLAAVFEQAWRVLRDDGILWIVIDDSHKDGDLMFIPARLAMAMQQTGWICRSEIIWNKDAAGRPENVTDRVTKNHEKVLMFTKQRQNFYNQDPIREPTMQPYSTISNKKPGLMRNDSSRSGRVWANPKGRNAGSV